MNMRRMIAAALLMSLAASGMSSAQDGAATPAPVAVAKPDSVEGLLVTLADIELSISVDRDFAGADKTLTELLIDVEAKGHSAWLQDARVAAAVTRIRTAIASARSVDQSELKQAVLTAMAAGDAAALGAMGNSGLELLSDMIRQGERSTLNSHTVSPASMLNMLLGLDVHRGTDVLLDVRSNWNAQQDGTWSSILAGALAPDRWRIIPGRRPEPPDPRLLDLVTEVLRGMKTTRNFGWEMQANSGGLGLLGNLAKFDALTPAMCAELVRILRASSWNDATGAIWMIRGPQQVTSPSARPIFEALLDDERTEARRVGAEALAASPDISRLLDAARDPDAVVRKTVAQSIRCRYVRRWVFEERDAVPEKPVQHEVQAPDDPRCLGVLEALARDADAGVREAAAESLMDLPDVAKPEVLRSLAHDPDPGVRATLASTGHPSPELVGELLMILSGDTEPLVLNKVDERLGDVNWGQGDTGDLMAFLPALEARAQNPTLPFGRGTQMRLEDILEVIAQAPEGRRELSRWSVQSGDPRPLQVVVQTIHPRGTNSYRSDDVNTWMAFEPGDIARLLPMLYQADPLLLRGYVNQLGTSTRRNGIADSVDPIVDDAAQPTSLRLQVASFALRADPTGKRVAAAARLLASPAVRDWEADSGPEASLVRDVVTAIPEADRNATIRGLVGADTSAASPGAFELKPDMPTALAQAILGGYAPAAPGGEELTRFVLRQWLDASASADQLNLVGTAIGALGALSDPESAQWLRRALRRVDHSNTALEAMSHRPEPDFLQDIGDAISADWVRELSQRQWISSQAISFLVGKFSPEAGEVLLARAGSAPTPNLRDQCLDGVTKIRSYLDSVDEWQKRKASAATREVAIARLIEMLHDTDATVRAESVRGLATLHAVEQLPAVIEALHDPDATVRKAAVQALDRLNAEAAVAEPASAGG